MSGAGTSRCWRRSTDDVPPGGDWLHEVKWDGYRAIADVRGAEATLTSRNDNDLTGRFESVAKEISKAVKTPDCVLDGEVCALDEQGRATFSAMQQGKDGTRYVYVVFDLLEVDGQPVVQLPLTERRKRLKGLLDRRNQNVQFSEAFEDGEALFQAANDQEFEGIISKRRESRYEPGRRNRNWLKVKTHGRQEFVVAGYTRGQGRREGRFGSLILGYWQGDELVYAGNVGTGFTDGEIDRLLRKLRPLERKKPTLEPVPKMPKIRKAAIVWVEPKLVAEVEFVEWTHDGRLRAPSYKGLREDKSTTDVRREEPEPMETEIQQGQARPQAVESRQAVLAGRGDHEGRPALVLPRGRRRGRPAPEGPAVHDEALPRRGVREVLLPERRAQAHARLDQERRDHGHNAGQAS